ncbi:hypothetical protein JI739_01530 [Ramlibacter sp. AW1]|uniref:Uncharacterized protein n=1 Tax=Ramlibacter aurantiacus TaxID=2801330 RepID=A0A937D5R4_9BURK|nr:hypothetical protein [Ramlibacter aurantiacus]MBL0419016.1 hypothetical protein [Ramlibacter aurantiacus]
MSKSDRNIPSSRPKTPLRKPTKQKPRQELRPTEDGPTARLFVADQFRTEVNGKVLAIGLYTDNVIVIPYDSPDPSTEKPLALNPLSILINIGGIVGKGRVVVHLHPMGERELEVQLAPLGSANLVINFQPLIIESIGRKDVRVTFAGQTKELTFEIRKATAEEAGRPAG